jgi:hypothetical protein
MPPYTWPNRVPKTTYDNLYKEYKELELYLKNSVWELKFFRKQQRRLRFQIVSNYVIMWIWFILILLLIIK